ncbi:hypothetical protein AJ80_03167 [Polytolypa hystricis UAMH7299]|uniref:UBC core domain-containing protein n=1 Tax=Polytolypa hystricis (strain UAMH7299) TaxID=1447883 RepID=A0A2B7YKB2_POLH7|nr:hypothetical protein AJ80_03167 [Polytolypa hystricis UAMH7299]
MVSTLNHSDPLPVLSADPAVLTSLSVKDTSLSTSGSSETSEPLLALRLSRYPMHSSEFSAFFMHGALTPAPPLQASNLRRLAADHASLHKSGLPPHYLWPQSTASSGIIIPDDLTQLTILLTGPQGTPYSQGLWRLHLRIPEDYPNSPPKAAFKTRIWHPNVEESTGAVCVDTLKKDWQSSLTLRDVLVTISCLLIHPNPDSALNSAAGSLLQEDYEDFSRQAKLMTSIHAPIPKDMKEAVMEAKRRGDESGTPLYEEEAQRRPMATRKISTLPSSVVMKKPTQRALENAKRTEKLDIRIRNTIPDSSASSTVQQQANEAESDDENDNPDIASKENDPSLSPSPVFLPPPSPRKSVLGKRPLSVLSSSDEPEMVLVDAGDDDGDDVDDAEHNGMTASERNIAANTNTTAKEQQSRTPQQPPRKSPKLSDLGRSFNASGRVRDDNLEQALSCHIEHKEPSSTDNNSAIYEDSTRRAAPPTSCSNSNNSGKDSGGKENVDSAVEPTPFNNNNTDAVLTAAKLKQKSSSAEPNNTSASTTPPLSSTPNPLPSAIKPAKFSASSATARKVSSSYIKAKPRIGLRRL